MNYGEIFKKHDLPSAGYKVFNLIIKSKPKVLKVADEDYYWHSRGTGNICSAHSLR